MEYRKTVILKDGSECLLRSGTEADGAAAKEIFDLTHAQTDFLTSYPEEHVMTAEQEALFLKEKARSPGEVEILAETGGRVAGCAGVSGLGSREKIRHRAEFGISVDRAYWGRGIGRALTEACIECAQAAGYSQLELSVVADNKNAVALYESVGFREYGRNPRGFRSRFTGWQELILMRLELDGK